MSNRCFTVNIPDNYIEFSEEELTMIETMIDIKSKYSTEDELKIVNSINEKLHPAKNYYDRLERYKAGFY